MAKLTVVIFAISFVCLILFDGVLTADEEIATTHKSTEKETTNAPTTLPQTKATPKMDIPIKTPAPATGNDPKPQEAGVTAAPATQATVAPKPGEEKKGNSSSNALAATVLPFVTTVFLITRF